ncbi:MAG: hypothetical protein A2Y84_01270 [Candidatus Colwellbacteria bacterium RBG_13_48_8]|uniref:Uncharacterized protein n=1 Tax=Candidatus Colwellbacteria bacterium RBG_13_48_8 TaxID=1797685 RepID=A0A1G1YXQ9_9BACT|nr:MAG: hypothetical protein A2Y84_01270 [Candidatus Colwellbacteria bacterium RBG_13_48_8]
MQNLFLELVFVVSLALIVYLMALAVPRMKEEEGMETPQKKINLHLDKLDTFFIKVKDKILRRTKILVMKIDNFISKQLRSRHERP